MRNNSGFIGSKSSISLSSAAGFFPLTEQQVQKGAGTWPLSGGDFTISPSVNNNSTWVFGTNGDLNLGSHGEWTITVLTSFSAIVKMWGGGGARGYDYSQTPTSTADQGDGGGGGYSSALINFVAGESYILRVGEGGARGNVSSSGTTYISGGIGTTDNNGGTEGGGYSGIFITSVTQGNAYLIAGGGGAGGALSVGTGGAGGGANGQNSTGPANQGGQGGTQIAGGGAASFNSPTAGSALTGGIGQSGSLTNASLGGGGGGYYGGGGGNVGGGGGGSGFAGTANSVSGSLTTVGSGGTPGNSTDSDRNGAGAGGSSTVGTTGANGRILIASALVSSINFDGTGDYITLPSSATLDLDANFTIESWVRLTATPVDFQMLMGSSISNTGTYISVGATKIFFQFGVTGLTQAEITYTMPTNTWVHLAFVRNSGVVSFYVNGVSQTVTNNSQNATFSPRYVGVGYSSSYTFPGYLSNFRVIKGTALYTSNFTPPQSTLSSVSGTSLLIGINQLYTNDFSSNRHLLTVAGNVTYSTTVKPF